MQLVLTDTNARANARQIDIVRLPEDFWQRIEALVGKNKMAEFIREAVERELKRRERKQEPD